MATETHTFQPGDRVRFVGHYNAPNRYFRSLIPEGTVGTVLSVWTGLYGRSLMVDFDGLEIARLMLVDEDDRLELVDA